MGCLSGLGDGGCATGELLVRAASIARSRKSHRTGADAVLLKHDLDDPHGKISTVGLVVSTRCFRSSGFTGALGMRASYERVYLPGVLWISRVDSVRIK